MNFILHLFSHISIQPLPIHHTYLFFVGAVGLSTCLSPASFHFILHTVVSDLFVVYIFNGILLSHKKDEILPFAATWMDLEGIMLSESRKTNIV